MPVFNAAAFVGEAVESVLRQTLAEIELIAVDDGSTDDSVAILQGYERSDPRVRVLGVGEHRGISRVLNVGWREARAPYIARLDADDVALPDRLVQQARFLDDEESVAVLGTATIIIDSNGRRGATTVHPTSPAAIRVTLRRRNCLAHPSVMVRRSALEQVGGYRFDHIEDYDLWLRLSESLDLANLREPLVLCRQHAGQVSFTTLEEQVRRQLIVRNAARARRSGLPDPLAGVTELDASAAERVGVDQRELRKAIEWEWLARAATIAEDSDEAVEGLIDDAVKRLGPRGRRAFFAACELKRADTLAASGRPAAGAAQVGAAVVRSPSYSAQRLSVWIGDRARRHLAERRS
jgi:glycosyltransferase involved in cell wall biosynthesis